MSDSVRPHRRQPTRLPHPWDSPGKNSRVGCHFPLQCMKVKSESEVAQSCLILAIPWTAAYQAPPSMGFSRQEYWSGVPLPSPILCILLHIFIDIHILWLRIVREHLFSSQNVCSIGSNTTLIWLIEMEVCFKQLLLIEFALFFSIKKLTFLLW